MALRKPVFNVPGGYQQVASTDQIACDAGAMTVAPPPGAPANSLSRLVVSITNFASPQAAIDYAATVGATITVPTGYVIGLSAPLIMKNGVGIQGNCTPDAGVGLTGCVVKALTPMSSLITQADLTVSLRNISIRGLTLDASSNVTGAAVDVAVISSHITDNVFQGPGYTTSTTGLKQRTPTNAFGWINYVSRNRIGSFGTGLNYNGSDSWITENYLSGNMINCILDSTGAIRFNANQVENAGPGPNNTFTGTGLILRNTQTGTTDKFAGFTITANGFVQNNIAIDIPDAPVAGFLANHNITANQIHDSRTNAIRVGANNNGGLIGANVFNENAGPAVINFAGSGCTKWAIGLNKYGGLIAPNPTRYANLPIDTVLFDDTTKIRQMIVDKGAFGYGSNAPLAAYGNTTELGAAFTLARFGVAQNASGFDPAILLRGINGNTMALDARDGELTQIADFLLMMNGIEQLRLRRGGGISMVNLPTSASGLPSGALWRNNNVLTVVP